MPVTIKTKDDVLTAYLKGDIDHHTAPSLREIIDDAVISVESAKLVILDFNEVSFMDSSGVGLVMGRYRLASSLSKKTEVRGLSERDFKIMKMSGIEKIAKVSKRN